ncbi:hypothetical protein [Thalassobaculum litoreum]|uniref:Uncharacterized protein n=1 Tax=Thalassobaculum litoreum DSM 18839 TaxID=1123362 RepID=A0A8G2BHZ1_9PROT|nr:hypothetical protein [Thalassobaculum litoreum]SDF82500.1 hypothetical protein SAMN05660686_02422 [Thalassobaculum litoreum DSM 18839]
MRPADNPNPELPPLTEKQAAVEIGKIIARRLAAQHHAEEQRKREAAS